MLVAQHDQRLGRHIVAGQRASPPGQDCPNAIGQCPLFMRQCAKGGDVCKALACGSDAVMVGSAFARAKEAPGRGNHWGMATPHANLPRGTRIKVGITGSLKQILFGPATVDDGSQNLVGAITTCMGNVGAANIRQFQETEIIIAPSIKTEGKLFQTVQSVGMGTR